MIKAAAIRFKGNVYTSIRHHLIIRELVGAGHNTPIIGEQGFVDDKDNFLDREQAASHALKCGQIASLKYSAKDLFSEDLW